VVVTAVFFFVVVVVAALLGYRLYMSYERTRRRPRR